MLNFVLRKACQSWLYVRITLILSLFSIAWSQIRTFKAYFQACNRLLWIGLQHCPTSASLSENSKTLHPIIFVSILAKDRSFHFLISIVYQCYSSNTSLDIGYILRKAIFQRISIRHVQQQKLN